MPAPSQTIRMVAFVAVHLLCSTLPGQERRELCKSSNMPLDFVPVQEVHTPGCDNSDGELTKNAWVIERVHPNITICEYPRWNEVGSKVLSLTTCSRVYAAECPPRSDGLANAIRLTAPEACIQSNVTHPPNLWKQPNRMHNVICKSEAEPYSTVAGIWSPLAKYRYKIRAEVTDSSCPPSPPAGLGDHSKNAYVTEYVRGSLKRSSCLLWQLDSFSNRLRYRSHRCRMGAARTTRAGCQTGWPSCQA
jgi:hypothetical protein